VLVVEAENIQVLSGNRLSFLGATYRLAAEAPVSHAEDAALETCLPVSCCLS
jgi:hypothetical protein